MLIKSADLQAIREGRVDTAFRRWKRPSVKAGGTLLTAIGQLAIDAVDIVTQEAITDAEAQRAGFPDAAILEAALAGSETGVLYRIRLRYLGDDPREALRSTVDDLDDVAKALARLDAGKAWTGPTLALIADRPGTAAQYLADALGMEKQLFKTRVRRLKALGLTESLDVGYRLSPRGEAMLRRGLIASA